jgi:hypothetical protein
LRIKQILAWADEHFRLTGRWPQRDCGRICGMLEENWMSVQNALNFGLRGLPGGDSLTQLLARERGVRNQAALPHLRTAQIVRWADAHFARTGQWPHAGSGPIPDAPGETWSAVQHALHRGSRGLSGGSSVAQLLRQRRGVGRVVSRQPLTTRQILAWADAHHARHARWPTISSGEIPEAAPLTWQAVSIALRTGSHGLPGGSSLGKLLKNERRARNRAYAPRLTERQILAWAGAHYRRCGRWPSSLSGAIQDASGETWNAVDLATEAGPARPVRRQLAGAFARRAAANAILGWTLMPCSPGASAQSLWTIGSLAAGRERRPRAGES